MKLKTNFSRWVVDIGGAQLLADRLNCSESAVYRWLRAEREPHFHTIRSMVRLGGGLSVADVHEHFERKERLTTYQRSI